MPCRKETILPWGVVLAMCLAVDSHAQFQNQQRATGINTGTGFGTQQGGFGAQPGFGSQNRGGGVGSQFGQQGIGQRGGFGQNAGQRARAGSAEAMAQVFENLNNQQRRQLVNNFNIENLNQMREGQTQGGRQRRSYGSVRVSIRPAFRVTPIDPTRLAPMLQSNLEASIELEGGTSTPIVNMEGRVATLSGTASDEHESAVLEKMLSLQPGVAEVDNRLVVASTESVERGIPGPTLPTPPPVE